ncbi:hypothetical protein [Candidatus Clostridium radicumherbarum]|uniref:Uncharacterized protein n=1 Tax=Candidatus Clostridium radicumherbarum TaxID=3381662 RepID=A0ABW8TWD4_9CLOT
MGNKGKLAAASFIAGAAAALYATKQMKNNTSPPSAAENHKAQAQGSNPTNAESNNFFIKAPSIGADNNIGTASKTQAYNNLYFENIPNSESIYNTFTSKSENSTATLNTTLKIDSW